MAVIVQIGQLRSIATLQRNAAVVDGAGGMIDSFIDVCTFRCNITQNKANRSIEQQQPVVNRSFKVICRSQALLTSNLNYDCRILFNDDQYAVNSFDQVDINKKHWYIITMSKNG